ncbi:VPLPA-CTERM sorting domain-containing protein [Pacificoceanicola onchidii]|uniref:VPLPA-CTERM sorting domain-containing protein n=1 Tax=Pacificoceanicola onchidii TaxID=2562685 RepID=UPI0010A5782A|nr:VPLPA-CTERM sorting domain-containing protein [Pacificoceanicola onchidii]
MKFSFLGALAFGVMLSGAAQAATLTNGSLTGGVANGFVPSGWSSTSGSPDTNDLSNNVGLSSIGFNAPPSGASPDGGTWVGIGAATSFNEGFAQTISDFLAGATYSLSWYAGNFGALSYTSTNSISVFLDGQLVGTGSALTLGSSWIAESISFTATSASQVLSFASTSNVPSYLSIDGIALSLLSEPGPTTPETSEVPLPAAGGLLTLGLGGLAFMRRRKSREV